MHSTHSILIILSFLNFISAEVAASSITIVYDQQEQLLRLPHHANVSDLLEVIHQNFPSAVSNPEAKPRLFNAHFDDVLHRLPPVEYESTELFTLGIMSGTKLTLVMQVPLLLFNLLLVDTLTANTYIFSKKFEIGKWSFLSELISEIKKFMKRYNAEKNPILFGIKWWAIKGNHSGWMSRTHCSSTRGIKARIRSHTSSVIDGRMSVYHMNHIKYMIASSDANSIQQYKATMMGETYTNIVLPMQYYIEFEEFDENQTNHRQPCTVATSKQNTKSTCCAIC